MSKKYYVMKSKMNGAMVVKTLTEQEAQNAIARSGFKFSFFGPFQTFADAELISNPVKVDERFNESTPFLLVEPNGNILELIKQKGGLN